MAKTKQQPETLADRIAFDLRLSAAQDTHGKGKMPVVVLVRSADEEKEALAILKKSKHPNAKLLSVKVEA